MQKKSAPRSLQSRKPVRQPAGPVLPAPPAIVIEAVDPCVECGRFPAKAVCGRPLVVQADVFKDGHDIIKAEVLYRRDSESEWRRVPMRFLENDRWQGEFIPESNTRYLYTVEAWMDPVATWLDHVEKKAGAYPTLPSEVDEGFKHFKAMSKLASAEDQQTLSKFMRRLQESAGSSEKILALTRDSDLCALLQAYPLKELQSRFTPELTLVVDRERALFGAWYEMFPRSQGRIPGASGTFQDCINRLPDIQKMGFNVLYLPPIHPIGSTNRKGPNNTLQAGDDAPGSPWAIGSAQGGHKAIHPELGTQKDFRHLVAEAQARGMEIALDFAIQCSPDHPYVKDHPEWFYQLPDGTIRYAENPPKKYEDIYPVNFHTPNRAALWLELKSIVSYWIDQGVKIFRVDNPHTKPLGFWPWLINEIQRDHPEVIFLAEAFTRPKVMKYLAKAGFTQSYTYFTWRNNKTELRQYLEELTRTEMRHYYRGNLFANTPDILHAVLQRGGRPAFKMRAVLAATLLPTWGIYNGFELCENQAKEEGSEEYLNSEKYEYKVWDWDRPGHIKNFIQILNRIRQENAALQEYSNLAFFDSRNDQVLCYGKWTADKRNVLVVCVNLDPWNTQEDLVCLPIWEWGIADNQEFEVEDLISGESYTWRGKEQFVRLDPRIEPAHIFKLKHP